MDILTNNFENSPASTSNDSAQEVTKEAETEENTESTLQNVDKNNLSDFKNLILNNDLTSYFKSNFKNFIGSVKGFLSKYTISKVLVAAPLLLLLIPIFLFLIVGLVFTIVIFVLIFLAGSTIVITLFLLFAILGILLVLTIIIIS